MCGIAGIARINADAAADRRTISNMLDSILHRGPDDEGTYQRGGVTIGMRRLSIIDLEGGHQPIANEDGKVWVVCNGEIYNFRQLRFELQALGHRFRTNSDAEVAVHAYETWGDGFLDHLDGMFGIALWDDRCRKLIIARDRLGIKPVYYHHANGRLAFASEIKALLTAPWISAAVDQDALYEYLLLGYAVAPATMFRGIKKLAPGERLVWQAGTITCDVYWQLPARVDGSLSDEQWIDRLHAELDRAVEDHLVADVPVGAFLSGGIDSSAIVALMADKLDEPVNTYSIGYEGSAVAAYYNELPFARQVADRYRTNHREIQVAPNVAELLPQLMWFLEEPISDTAIITTYLVAQLASESVKVIMSGVGGDELFAGYNRYLGNRYGAAYGRLPSWLKGRLIEPVAELLPSGRNNRLLDLSRYAKEFVRAGRLDWRGQYKSFVKLAADDILMELAGSEEVDGFDRAASSATVDDPLLRLFWVDAATQLPEGLLLLTDKMTMATSIECRVPFLDRRLVEAAATIPAGSKLRKGELKYLFKRAVADILPPEILKRRKRGFGAPVGAWLQRELAPLRSVLLAESSLGSRGLVDGGAVHRICAQHDTRAEDYTDLLMVLMNLEIWCRVFLDGSSPGDVALDLLDETKAA